MSRVAEMRGYWAVCMRHHVLTDAEGTVMRLVAGRKYLISRMRRGRVTVFCDPMVTAPAQVFERPEHWDKRRRSRLLAAA